VKYTVKYRNGVVQTLTLVPQAEWVYMRLVNGICQMFEDVEVFTARERGIYDAALIAKEKYEPITKLFKDYKGFTDGSPIYMSQFRDGYIVLCHGKFKCELNLVDSE